VLLSSFNAKTLLFAPKFGTRPIRLTPPARSVSLNGLTGGVSCSRSGNNHNSFSHAINDCNVFRRQVQSAINEGRLTFHEMQVDKAPFPINTMDLQQPKVLVRLHQAEASKGKNVVIGEAKPGFRGKWLICKVEYEKTPDVKETFKVTVSASGHGGAMGVHSRRSATV
jgi:hypothetical protein